jgi:Tfp pilus assembly protein PilZ
MDSSAQRRGHMKERRKNPRYQTALKARFETKKGFQNAVVYSLSSGGLYLATERPLEVGRQFRIELNLQKRKSWIKGICEVVWVNQTIKNYPKWIYGLQILKGVAPQVLYKGMGVKFVQILPQHRKRIEEYIGKALLNMMTQIQPKNH